VVKGPNNAAHGSHGDAGLDCLGCDTTGLAAEFACNLSCGIRNPTRTRDGVNPRGSGYSESAMLSHIASLVGYL
jgi:hypothetical protein